jgi:hypothetical protein
MNGARIAGEIVPGAANSIAPTAKRYAATRMNETAITVTPTGLSISHETNKYAFGLRD